MIMKRLFFVAMFLAAWSGLAQTPPASLPELPSPTKTIQDKKQFNAVTLGPGNNFSIRAAPPDFQLDSFGLSPDGKWVFLGWASGRLEVRDSQTETRIGEFKPMQGPIFEADYNEQTKQLLVTGQHGLIRFVDPHSGKMLREIHAEIGKRKYDIQKVIVAGDGSWLAYVNQENGKILDLKSEPPNSLADLGDAYDLALTRDESELWLVNREKIIGLKVGSWKEIGSAPLLDKVRPDGTPSLAVVSAGQGAVAFVPSQSGLLRYELNTINGRKVTQNPAYWVGINAASNEILVNEMHALSLYSSDGTVRCQWKQHRSRELKVNENGEWLGSLDFGKVELWSLSSLASSCAEHKPKQYARAGADLFFKVRGFPSRSRAADLPNRRYTCRRLKSAKDGKREHAHQSLLRLLPARESHHELLPLALENAL
jgi:WD40 repeat protein